MSELTASFLGRDCPGVVAAIAALFGDSGCNIVAMSQMRFSGEFAAIFIVEPPEGMESARLLETLEKGLAKAEVDLSVMVRPSVRDQWGGDIVCQPYVVTVDGPDGPGLIAAISRVFARHGVNIESLTAYLGQVKPGNALFVFEVMAPEKVDIGRVRRELDLEAKNLGLRVSVQHRDIFEAVHRVNGY